MNNEKESYNNNFHHFYPNKSAM